MENSPLVPQLISNGNGDSMVNIVSSTNTKFVGLRDKQNVSKLSDLNQNVYRNLDKPEEALRQSVYNPKRYMTFSNQKLKTLRNSAIHYEEAKPQEDLIYSYGNFHGKDKR